MIMKKITKKSKIFIFIAFIVCFIIVVGTIRLAPDTNKSENIPPQTISIDKTKYTKVTSSYLGISYWLNTNWKEVGGAGTLRNYDLTQIENELKTGGRYEQTNGTFADLTNRTIKSYPYTLDSLYEVFITAGELNSENLNLSDYVKKDYGKSGRFTKKSGRNIEDLKIYKVNQNEIADFIFSEGENNAKGTRFIVMIKDKKTVHFEISPTETRKRTTKNNFDGLLELVGSTEL